MVPFTFRDLYHRLCLGSEYIFYCWDSLTDNTKPS
jgi:hypothetical protein